MGKQKQEQKSQTILTYITISRENNILISKELELWFLKKSAGEIIINSWELKAKGCNVNTYWIGHKTVVRG